MVWFGYMVDVKSELKLKNIYILAAYWERNGFWFAQFNFNGLSSIMAAKQSIIWLNHAISLAGCCRGVIVFKPLIVWSFMHGSLLENGHGAFWMCNDGDW